MLFCEEVGKEPDKDFTYIEYKDKIAFHPGYYIEECMVDQKIRLDILAEELNISPEELFQIIIGERNLSVDLALRLGRIFHTGAAYWGGLQKRYDELLKEFTLDKLEKCKNRKGIWKNIDTNYRI